MAVLSHEGTYPIMYGAWPIPVGAGHRDGYIARPDEEGRFPVVIVVQDVDGLTSFEKDVCRRLARSGFAAISLSLYPATADGLASYHRLPDARALGDLDEVHDFVLSDDVTWNAGEGAGLFGAGVGGRLALLMGATRDWVDAVAVAYSPMTGDEERAHQVADYLGNLPVPILALYGADDDLIDPESVDEAQSRNEHGQWLLYEGVGHGFLDVNHEGFDQAAADDAFARILAFFGATLPEPEVEELG